MTAVTAGSPAIARAAAWLRAGRGGMFLLALFVGAGAGLGAVAFRYLIYFFTWLATGHSEFGQAGYVGSSHLPWLGLGFFVVIPVIGGLLYGPLIYKWAREARGHGVPEVMIAVADNGGRIRWQVSVVKALASALCIGSGGSVGREGPIVQIGSALASSVGQWVRMPENRLRIMVACGAAGGISATFNAPITGVFFGVEIILREFAVDALFTVMLSAMVADVIAIPFLGDKPFLSGFPAGIALHHPSTYLLVAGLAVVAALMGLAFTKVLYKVEDLCDALWKGRPEWAQARRRRDRASACCCSRCRRCTASATRSCTRPRPASTRCGSWSSSRSARSSRPACRSGSAAPAGSSPRRCSSASPPATPTATSSHHIFGAGAGQPALYAVVAMGAVFTSAARAPLTSLASVVEMTGDFALTLPVMLAVAIASTVSRALSYGTIYTTKLLRRGTDIDQAAPWRALADLKITDVMRPFRPALPVPPDSTAPAAHGGSPAGNGSTPQPDAVPGPVTGRHDPQALFASESLSQALRQLEVYGRDGLPVLSPDGQRVEGWVTGASVLRALARQITGSQADTIAGAGRRRPGAPRRGGHAPAPAGPAARLPGHRDHRIRGLARRRTETGRPPLAVGRHPRLRAARPPPPPAGRPDHAGRRRPGQPAHPGTAELTPAAHRRPRSQPASTGSSSL